MRNIKYSYYLRAIVVFLLFISVFTSCIYDDVVEQEEHGLIIVQVGFDEIETRAAGDILFPGTDAEITKVRIFVFVGELLEINQLFTSGESQFTNPFVLDVATGLKDVYVVANESSSLTPILETVNTKAGLTAILADQIYAPVTPPLVMTGSVSNVSVIEKIDPDRNSITIPLTRVAAKISLEFKKDTDANVSITKVSLLNNTNKTAIWGGGASITGQSYWNWSHTLATALDLNSTATNISGQENIYLYENLAGPENKDDAVQLEVEALYNGIPTKYRVYINENVTSPGSGIAGDPMSSETNPNDHLYSIKRNHNYKLTGTIMNIGEFDGLILTTNVLPWNYLPSSISFERIYTIQPIPTPANHTYTISGTGEVSFTFKLASPIDASWIANLTNFNDFEFVGVFQGETNDEVIIKIKTKNSPGTVERFAEFYINVEYGGNWEEIPLLSGSTMIGSGNRVIIKQLANP
ncbi:MAG: fimbrial protein [Dysgonamonadaceae bacterium]